MVIGQLGVLGLIIFILLFVALTKIGLSISDVREKVLALSLTFAYLTNFLFNEVALSPNSAAPYFVVIGLVIGKELMRREDFASGLTQRLGIHVSARSLS
jgi:hypothetical protein